MTLPKDFSKNNSQYKRNLKERLKDIGVWVLFLTIPAGIVIIVIGYIMENLLLHLGVFVMCVPFGIMYFGFSWRERTAGDWCSLIFLGAMLGIAIWLGVTYGVEFSR